METPTIDTASWLTELGTEVVEADFCRNLNAQWQAKYQDTMETWAAQGVAHQEEVAALRKALELADKTILYDSTVMQRRLPDAA